MSKEAEQYESQRKSTMSLTPYTEESRLAMDFAIQTVKAAENMIFQAKRVEELESLRATRALDTKEKDLLGSLNANLDDYEKFFDDLKGTRNENVGFLEARRKPISNESARDKSLREDREKYAGEIDEYITTISRRKIA
jgi:hypothetical protein